MFKPIDFLLLTEFTAFYLGIPVLVCILHHRKPTWFDHAFKIFGWILALSLLSELYWAVHALVEFQLGHYPRNGFTVVCFLFVYWIFIWITGIPIFLGYALFRLLRKQCAKQRENHTESQGKRP